MPLDEELGLDLPFKDLRHETALNIVRTATLLAQAGAALFRRFDLTEAQFNVLLVLKYTERELTQAELGRRLIVSRASITSVLDRLEGKGLVNRRSVEGNRRIHHVELAARGHQLVEQAEPAYRDAIHAALGALDDAECRSLVAALERVREHMRGALLGEAGPNKSAQAGEHEGDAL